MKVGFKNLENMRFQKTINKEDAPDIFFENDEMTSVDVALFAKKLNSDIIGNERTFFEEMKKKEEGEYAISADLILCEDDNRDEIYIVRYYFDEYRIGRGKLGHRYPETFTDNLTDALKSDLIEQLNYHITLYDWLKKTDFEGIRYDGNYAL